MTINIVLDGHCLPVSRTSFTSLFENSVVNDRAAVRKALKTSAMPFNKLVEMARIAEIPYPLFFAPEDVVVEQLRLKTEKLMAGFTKECFSMNSRHRVHLADVELIVKDLIRKQQMLKADSTLKKNTVVGCIRHGGSTVADDASCLLDALDMSRGDIRAPRTKERGLESMIAKLEAKQVLVSRSAKNFMPQQMPKRAKFSGMTIKDSKVPYIFLATGDEGEHLEPAGRKVFTLTLLTVLLGRGTFAPVTYDGHTTETNSSREYEVTAEILMPAKEIRGSSLATLDDVKAIGEACKVTPSAVVMRARRLGILNAEVASRYLDALAEEYANRTDPPKRNALAVNALRKYNGTECSRRMLGLLDSGNIQPGDFCRVMFLNKLRPNQIPDFRAAVS